MLLYIYILHIRYNFIPNYILILQLIILGNDRENLIKGIDKNY